MSAFQLTISFLSSLSFPLDIDPSNSFQDIKEKIEARTGYPHFDQRFIYLGKSISEDRSLSDYDVRGDTKLHVSATGKLPLCENVLKKKNFGV